MSRSSAPAWPRLVVFDMDGTLVPGTTADLFYAGLFGMESAVRALEARHRSGALGSLELTEELAARLPDLTIQLVEKNFPRLPHVQGIAEVVGALRDRSIRTAIVTASNVLYARCFQREFGFDHAFGCEHQIGAGGRIGRGITTCHGEEKVARVHALAREQGWTFADVAAVGDSADDAPLLAASGIAIAFNALEPSSLPTEIVVNSDDLRDVLPFLLFSDQDHAPLLPR